MASSIPSRHLLVMVERVCRGVMMSRSQSGLREKTSSTLSSISRCWAVTQQMDSRFSRPASSLTRGAILMASGRVPNTLMMRSFSMAYSFPSPGASGGVPSVFSPPPALGLAPSAGWWLWG